MHCKELDSVKMIEPQLKNWRKVRLGDFFEINPKVKLEKEEEYPYVEMADLDPSKREVTPLVTKRYEGGGARFEEGDVLFARITPSLEHGKIAQASGFSGPAFGSTEFFVLRGKERVSETDFVYYLSRTRNVRIPAEQSMIGASGRQRVEKDAFENMRVFVPDDLTEQKRIATILSAFDDKIELNNKINQTLEQMAQAIFKEWFAAPSEALAREGELPKGWEVKNLGEVANFQNGFVFRSKDMYETGYAGIVRIKNVKGPIINTADLVFVSEKIATNASEFILNRGDILIGMTGYVGEVGLVPSSPTPLLLNQRVGRFGFSIQKYKPYVFFFLRQAITKARFINKARGSAQPNLSTEGIKTEQVVIPTEDILSLFSDIAGPAIEKLLQGYEENQKLASLRDLLLPKLMSGKVEV